jgi:TPR repeat protein
MAPAQYTLARMYEAGEGDPSKNASDAIIWYINAAQKGMAKAQLRLAQLYETGTGGVPKNLKEAVKWYEKSIKDGSQRGAMVALGHLYETGGEGLKQDLKKAKDWYQRAADTGYGDAQMELARMYRDGVGMPRDLVRAYQWFTLAAVALQGDDKASAVLARIQVGNMMSPEQQAQAREAASRWTPAIDPTKLASKKPDKNAPQLKYE